jgi:hypothetical protein
VSTIISLLSTLCRGSPSITHVSSEHTTEFAQVSAQMSYELYYNVVDWPHRSFSGPSCLMHLRKHSKVTKDACWIR